MLSDIFQKLIIFFRKKYISSLKPFKVKVDPKEIKEETYSKLSQQFKDQFDKYSTDYNRWLDFLHKEKMIEIDFLASDYINKSNNEKLVFKEMKESGESQRRIEKIDKIVRNINSYTNLYLIGFNQNLTISEARSELQRIGFKPADFLETILFVQQYKESIPRLPIIALDACFNKDVSDKQINTLEKNGYFCVSFHGDILPLNKSGFSDIGDVESFQEHRGSTFRKNILFLVKPI